MPQTNISEDGLSRMRKAVQASRPHIIYKIPACGYSGITRTTNETIYTQLVRFHFPAQALQDRNNTNALKRSIRDIVQGRVPSWKECSKMDQMRMIGKVEDRYSWMKCFEAHWLSEVLLGKHVTSKARDMRKASAAKLIVISTPTPGSSLLDRYQSNQGELGDANSELAEHTDLSSTEEDIQAGETVTVEDDTDDSNMLEEDMDKSSDDRSESLAPLKLSGRTDLSKQNRSEKLISTASTSTVSSPTYKDHTEKHALKRRAAVEIMRDNKGKSLANRTPKSDFEGALRFLSFLDRIQFA